MSPTSDTAKVLDAVADAADGVARDQRGVATRVRLMKRRRAQGWSWSRILDHDREPGTLTLVARSTRRVGDLAGRLREALARGLVSEGHSIRQIARGFGVSHQRISKMLNGSTREPDESS